MSWLKFTSMPRASFPCMPSTEKHKYKSFPFTCGTDYAYPSSFFPNKRGFSPLVQTFKYLPKRRGVWHWSWHQYVITIIPKSVFNLLYPIYHYLEVPPFLICCIPGGWGVCRLQRLKGRIFERSVWVCHILANPVAYIEECDTDVTLSMRLCGVTA